MIVLSTVDPSGAPSVALLSWVVAKTPKRLAMALDVRSSAFKNLSAGNRAVAFELLADDTVLSARGTASIVRERLARVPFACALVEIDITEIRDHRVPGIHFRAPQYLFADGKTHRSDVERAVFEELESSN